MRALGMVSMTALILTGLPPAPIAPAPAAVQRGAPRRAGRGSRRALRALPPRFRRRRSAPAMAAAASRLPVARARRRAAAARLRAAAAAAPAPTTRRRRRRRRVAAGAAGRGDRAAVARRDLQSVTPVTVIGGHDLALRALARQSRALCRRGGRRGPGGRRRAGLDLLGRRRHRLLRQCPADAERRARCRRRPRSAPRRCSTISATIIRRPQDRVAAVQRHHRHDDDAVEPRTPGCCASACAATTCRAASGRRRTSSSWSTSRARWTSPTSCRWCNARWPCSPTGCSPRDRVSIVVYAGAAGLVLEPTSRPRRDRRARSTRLAGRRLDRGRRRASSSPIDVARAQHDRGRHQPRHPRHRRRLQRRRHRQRGADRHGRARARGRASP